MDRDETLALWIDTYGEKLIRLAQVYTRNRQMAEDCVQEALIRAYRTDRVIPDHSNPFPWLARIVINECKRGLRKQTRRANYHEVLLNDGVESAENSYIAQTTARVVHEAVMSLPDKYRLPIVLYYFEEVPVQEIANVIGKPVGTVKSRLARGRERLHKKLTKEEESNEHRRAHPRSQTLS